MTINPDLYDIQVLHDPDAPDGPLWIVRAERTQKPRRCVAIRYVRSEQEAEKVRSFFDARYNKREVAK